MSRLWSALLALQRQVVNTLVVLALLAGFAVAGAGQARAAEPVLSFDSPEQEALYKVLIQEYRCLKCQNQNLADSGAGLADDLRRQVYRQVVAGNSKQEIDEYLTSRYGDFVLYRPPFRATTWLLWIGPFVLLAVALVWGYRLGRSHPGGTSDPVTSDAVEEARRFLDDSQNR